MPTIPQQIKDIADQASANLAMINGTRDKGLLYAIAGDHCVFGCLVTEGASATDMYLALDGQDAGDTANLNPDIVNPAARHEEYPNIALVYGEAFESENVNTASNDSDSLLVEVAPQTQYYGRYDVVYAYVGTSGPAVKIEKGTALTSISTLSTAASGDEANDPSLPHGTIPLARRSPAAIR